MTKRRGNKKCPVPSTYAKKDGGLGETVKRDAMNYDMTLALRCCVENALGRNLTVEMVVPRLKPIWPTSCNRRDLLQEIRTFAAENGWDAEIFDFRFRVRFVRTYR